MKQPLWNRIFWKLDDAKWYNKYFYQPIEKLDKKTFKFRQKYKHAIDFIRGYFIIPFIIMISIINFSSVTTTAKALDHYKENNIYPYLEKQLRIPKGQIYVTLEERPIMNEFFSLLNIKDNSSFVYRVDTQNNASYLLKLEQDKRGQISQIELIPQN